MTSLAFHALNYSSAASPHVDTGVGDLTEARTSIIYLPDDSGIWQAFASTVPGKVYANAQWWLYGGPALTNSQIQSNDLTNAEWTAVNMTVAQDETGMRNDANAACTLTSTAGNATVIAGAITAGSADQTTRWFIKRKTGTGVIEITVNNGATWEDVTTEVDSTAGFNEANESLAALTNPQIGIRIVTSGDAVIVGNAECHTAKTEAAIRGSTPIFTAGSTGSVNATDLSFDDANHGDAQGAYFLKFKNVGVTGASPTQGGLIGMGAAGRIFHIDSVNKFSSDDGPTTVDGPVISFGANDVEYEVALAYGSSLRRINTDDAWGTAGAYDGVFNNAQSKLNVLHDPTLSTAPLTTMLMRNLRRYDMTYDEAIQAIPLMMNGTFPVDHVHLGSANLGGGGLGGSTLEQ